MSLQPTPESRLTKDDRRLVQRIGGRLRNIFQGKDVALEDVDRIDELGILANMVNRVARELANSRQRDEQQRRDLEQQLQELQHAHAMQQRLLATINELSTPVLDIQPGILLLPIIGSLDSTRAAHIIETLLERIGASQARIVILDITAVTAVDTHVANVLLQAAQAAALLGSTVILCGITPEVAQVVVSLGIDLSRLQPYRDLQSALARALALQGRRIVG